MVLPQPQPGAPLPRSLVEELEARLRALTEEYESRLSDRPEVDDLSQVVYGRALQEARDALARIEEGTYGTCETCSGQIGVERLEALPHTTACAFCAGRSTDRR
jgi:RNA polymerase-binding transcription factor DksA